MRRHISRSGVPVWPSEFPSPSRNSGASRKARPSRSSQEATGWCYGKKAYDLNEMLAAVEPENLHLKWMRVRHKAAKDGKPRACHPKRGHSPVGYRPQAACTQQVNTQFLLTCSLAQSRRVAARSTAPWACGRTTFATACGSRQPPRPRPLAKVTDFLLRHHRATPLAAIGIGSFGPLDLRTGSPTYGYITTTPKPGWRNADVVGPIREKLKLPVVFDTDVNAAALGECRWGAGRGLDSLVYITVGTGIGGGAVIDGRPVHGASHPEMGHVLVPRDRAV